MTTHQERLQACLRGETTDRPPVALWRHFPVDDQTPEALAAAVINFQNTYDFDLVKVTPASSFCVRDWGVEDQWAGDTEGTRRYTRRAIRAPGDWEALPALEPAAPHLARQLACLQMIRRELADHIPIIQTIFSPLAQAKNLAGNETLITHLRLYPEAVQKGLIAIARSTERFVEAALETGIDGIFYAVQHAQAGLLTRREYATFGLPYDRQATRPAESAWCNLLHLHGRDVYFDLAGELKCQIVNWHDRETPPRLEEAQSLFPGVVCGGMRQDTLVYGDQAEVRREAEEALQQTGGKRFILGTGCVVPIIASYGNLMAARHSVDAETRS